LGLIFSLCLSWAWAQSKPGVVMSQIQWLAPLPAGRALEGVDAAGTSIAVNADGNLLIGDTYGNQVLLVNGQTGNVTVMGTLGSGYSYGVGAVTIDKDNNLYIAGIYEPYIAKIPYVDGTYAPVSTPTSVTPACTGNDTAECLWGRNLAYSGNGYWYGVLSMTFDSAGNFYFATDGTGSSDPFSIYECSGACVTDAATSSGSSPPTLLYKEPAATHSTIAANAQGVDCAANGSTVQETPGGLAVDGWGNLFFTESAIDTCGAVHGEVNQSDSSSLREIATRAGPPYRAPILYTLVPANPGIYDDELDGVAVDSNGTVYFTGQDDGVFAFANQGTLFTTTPAGIYTVATTGSKVLAVDGVGSLYVVSSLASGNSGTFVDTVGRSKASSLMVPPSAAGTDSGTGASLNVIDNGSDCASSPTFTVTAKEDGQPTQEFAGAVTGGCEDNLFNDAVFAATLQAAPSVVGGRSALITVEDSLGNSGEAIASTVGEGAEVALDPGSASTAYRGFLDPAAVAVNGAGDIFVADPSDNAIEEIAAGAKAAVLIGAGLQSPSGVAVDENDDLYIADSAHDRIVEIADLDGARQQSTVVSSSTAIGGTTLNHPTALAVGADGVLYAVDAGNGRVVTYNPENDLVGVRVLGLSNPTGMAVDRAGDLYVSSQGAGGAPGSVEMYAASGRATITPNGVTRPDGLAVEPSGAVLVADQETGRIVRIPVEKGSLAPADATGIETNPVSAGGLALDARGDLYATDPSGGVVYRIERAGAVLDFGSVEDGSSSATLRVNAENIGNETMMPAAGTTGFVTLPSTDMFNIGAGSPDDCLTATTLGAGEGCDFSAQFAPVLGASAGFVSNTIDFASSAQDAFVPITLTGTAVYVAAPPPSFILSMSSSTIDLEKAGASQTDITITPMNGFTGSVTFRCSGLPIGATCEFSPAMVSATGNAPVMTQLKVSANFAIASLADGVSLSGRGSILACGFFFLLGTRTRRHLLKRFATLGVLLLSGAMVTGCGTLLNNPHSTSTVTVTATSGSQQQQATFTLIT
jgi:sugar lactone lactonase YvrE